MKTSRSSSPCGRLVRRAILTGSILPFALATAAFGAPLLIPPNTTINGDGGTEIFNEGLIEGHINGNAFDVTTPNPANSSPELGLRLGQTSGGEGADPDGWQLNNTWVYTGQIFTGPGDGLTSTFSFAAHNDDNERLVINNQVLINDTNWETAIPGTITGLPINTWVDFEYRVGNGGGGAGPSGRNFPDFAAGPTDQLNWNNTFGVVYSNVDELGSHNRTDYDLGRPVEVANGTPELFRYSAGFGLTDDLIVQATGTLTVDGSSGVVGEASLSFETAGAKTFTINDGSGPHKVLTILNTTQWATVSSAGAAITLAGTADLRPSLMTDNGIAVSVTQSGPGTLFLDSTAPHTVGNTSFAVTGGVISISGATNPIVGRPLTIGNAAGTLRFGGTGTFNNPITVSASGTIEHTDANTTVLSGAINTTAASVVVNSTAGNLRMTGAITGQGLTKTGGGIAEISQNLNLPAGSVAVDAGTLRTQGGATIANVTVNGGLYETSGTLTNVTNTTSVTGGTLTALTNFQGKFVTVSGGTMNTQGNLTMTGAGNLLTVSGGTLNARGASSLPNTLVSAGFLRATGSATVGAITVTGGRAEFSGTTTLAVQPSVSAGATLALRSGTGNNLSFGGSLVVAGGTFEVVPGAVNELFGAKPITLAGGTLTLDAGFTSGLNAHIYTGVNPDPAARVAFGTATPGGANTSVNSDQGNFGTYTAHFAGLESGGAVRTTTTTSANGNTGLNFPDNGQNPFSIIGAPLTPGDNIQTRLDGYLFAPVAGTYSFGTSSDDGSVLFIDGQSIVYNNAFQGNTRRNGSVSLTQGYHTIEIGFYEGGGGANLAVFQTAPGGGDQILSNSSLVTGIGSAIFTNDVTVTTGGTINVTAQDAVLPNVIVPNGITLNTAGNALKINTLALTGSSTFDVANETTVLDLDDTAGPVAITKIGPGTLIFDIPPAPQFPVGSTIAVNGGALGIILGGAVPTGAAAITFNGGGVVLSSIDSVDKIYTPMPDFANGGVLGAKQLGSGVAGTPGDHIVVTVPGNINLGAGRTLSLTTGNDYELSLSGAATGSGTVEVGGIINSNSNGTFQGLNVLTKAGTTTATLNLKTSAPTLASLASSGADGSVVVLGNGTDPSVLTLTGSANATFSGSITEAGPSSVGSLVKQGTGTLRLGGTSTFSGGVTVSSGTLEIKPGSVGTGAITLGAATLQFFNTGLFGQFYTGIDGGAHDAFAGPDIPANTFTTYDSFFDGQTPAVQAQTDINGVTRLDFQSGDEVPMFGTLGFTGIHNIVSRMSGQILVPTGGSYTFRTSSDDGSMLFIDGAKVVSNNRYQGRTEVAGTVTLTAGTHDIDIGFYEGGGGHSLTVEWEGPGIGREILPNRVLESRTYNDPTTAVNLIANGTIDLRGGTVGMGQLVQTPGTTLTTTAGKVGFASATLAAGTYTYTGAGTVNLKQINGNAGITLNESGPGTLALTVPLAAQLTGVGNSLNASGGGTILGVLGDSNIAAINPFGAAGINLNNGRLALSSNYAGPASFSNLVTLSGNSTISAGNFGCGAVDGQLVSATSLVTVGGGQTLTVNASNNYILDLSGGVSGAGNLVSNGGTVQAASINLNTVAVTSGTLAVAGNLASSGTTVDGLATLQLGTGTVTGPITVHGGTLRVAAGGSVNLSNLVTFTTNTQTNALLGRFMASGAAGNTEGGVATIRNQTALSQVLLTSALSFGGQGAGDGAISALFGGVNTGSFSLGFFGKFTVPIGGDGTYQVQAGLIDDNAGFWVDLDQDGVFEVAGDAGNELLSSGGCCMDGPIGSAPLIGGESYDIAIAVQDTGGGGSIVGRAGFPGGGGLGTINPSDPLQAGLFSIDLANDVDVETGATLDINSINGATNVFVDGTLDINGPGINSIGNLEIGDGGVVNLGGGLPPPSPEDALLGGDLGGGSAQAVPEPGSVSLLALGVLGLLGRRRVRRS